LLRNTSDILTNKVINGNNNTITNIGNSSLTNNSININGTSVALGGSITVSASDPYTDEKAQDTIAGMFTTGIHTGISFNYDDTTGRINATVDSYILLATLKSTVAASTDFADFQSRIAAL